MPWYKSGTVSVTQNSNAVIGAGTAFIAYSRVGDAFRGPDGAWYEVTNIASDTSMSIDPPYKGATNAAGGYALAPMQGYVKDSADALRLLVNTYGAKLAALGTTGNYDILPVNKGGTGGADQASARSGLGLGNGATRSVQASSHDSTAGSLLLPGAYGWGLVGASLLAITDANGFRPSGLYFASNGALNVPLAGDALLEVRNLSPQVIYETITYYASRRKFERVFVTTSWSAWDEVLTSSSFANAFQGGVGSYSLLKNISGATISISSVVAASYLSYSDTANSSFGSPPGAWRAMSAVGNGYSTLFLRLN